MCAVISGCQNLAVSNVSDVSDVSHLGYITYILFLFVFADGGRISGLRLPLMTRSVIANIRLFTANVKVG